MLLSKNCFIGVNELMFKYTFWWALKIEKADDFV